MGRNPIKTRYHRRRCGRIVSATGDANVVQRCTACDSQRVTANHSGDESAVSVTVVADLTVVDEIDVVNHTPTSGWFVEFSVGGLDPAIDYVNIHACAGVGVAVIVGGA